MITNQPNKVQVDVVEKKEASVKGVPSSEIGTPVSVDVKNNEFTQYSFSLRLKKSGGTLFNTITDKGSTIHLTVKDGEDPVYDIIDIFNKIDKPENYFDHFTITLPNEKEHYTDALTIVGTVTLKNRTEKKFFIESGSVKDGNVFLRINAAPVITFKGADGNGGTTQSTEFHVSTQNTNVIVFAVADAFGGTLKTTYHWKLYKDNKWIRDIVQKANEDGVMNPHKFDYANNKYLRDLGPVELAKYYLKVNVTANDGIAPEVTKEFTFTFTKL